MIKLTTTHGSLYVIADDIRAIRQNIKCTLVVCKDQEWYVEETPEQVHKLWEDYFRSE